MAESKPDFAKASPRPWRANEAGQIYSLDDVVPIADATSGVSGWRGDMLDAANAALIVHSVNSIDRITAERDELIEALAKLSAEVGGMKAFDIGIREVTGNTNWNVLMLRDQEACALLARLEKTGGAS